MRCRTSSSLGSALAFGAVTVVGAACYTQVNNIPCCDLYGGTVYSYNCTNDPNCKDLLESSGNINHFKTDAPPGASGRTALANAATCTCTITRMMCSAGGYCVEKPGEPVVPHTLQPKVPSGGEPCTVPNSGGGGGGDPD